MLAEQ